MSDEKFFRLVLNSSGGLAAMLWDLWISKAIAPDIKKSLPPSKPAIMLAQYILVEQAETLTDNERSLVSAIANHSPDQALGPETLNLLEDLYDDYERTALPV